MWVMVTIEIVDVNFLISLIFIFWTPDEDITFSLLVEIIILMSYGFFLAKFGSICNEIVVFSICHCVQDRV